MRHRFVVIAATLGALALSQVALAATAGPSVRPPVTSGSAVVAPPATDGTSTTSPSVAAASSPLVTLTGSVFKGIDAVVPSGDVPLDQVMHVALSVQSRDPAGLQAALADATDPHLAGSVASLDPATWDARFGPDPAARAAAVAWLQQGGLDVLDASGSLVYAVGTAQQMSDRFGVHLRTFAVAGRAFYANVDAPKVPAIAGVTAVLGLSDYKQAQTLHHAASSPSSAQPQAFPMSASTSAQDLWSIYDMPANNLGDGEGLAVFGWNMDGAQIEHDLRSFEVENHLPAVPFAAIQFGIQPGSDRAPDTNPDLAVEWDLDTQASSGMAPNASSITAYSAYSSADADLIAPLNGWVNDANGARQGSASFGECEEDPVFSSLGLIGSAESGTETAWNQVLAQGVLEGRTLFVSSGDSGFGCDPTGNTINGVTLGPVPYQSWPAVSPYVVAVGGTVITTNDANPPQRDIEYAWTHGGGGPSLFVDQPAYQAGVVPLPTRGVPDVASQSGDLLSGYNIIVRDERMSVGGTSLSAPLWQGIWARVSAASGLLTADVGFANPHLYAASAAQPDSFYDVTLGTNGLNIALPGWDYTTGLGVPDVSVLMTAIDGRTTPRLPMHHAPLTQPACAAGVPPLTDAGDDATGLIIGGLPRPSDPDLDILSADAALSGTNLVLTMHVAQLSSSTPVGGTGDAFDIGFHYGTDAFWVQASRGLTGSGADFGRGDDSRGTSFGEAGVTASFDVANSNVVVSLPLAVLNAHISAGAPPVGAGSVLDAFSAQTWATVVVLNGGVDSATGDCAKQL